MFFFVSTKKYSHFNLEINLTIVILAEVAVCRWYSGDRAWIKSHHTKNDSPAKNINEKSFPFRWIWRLGRCSMFKVVSYRSTHNLDYETTKRENELSSESNLISWNDQNPLDSNGSHFFLFLSTSRFLGHFSFFVEQSFE